MLPRRLATPVCPSSRLLLRSSISLLTALGLGIAALPQAQADTLGQTTVAASTSVYATSTQTYGGSSEILIPIAAGTTQITFSISETGGPDTVSVNGGGNYNDPDGVGNSNGETIYGPNQNLSGVVTPYAGTLMGVFTDGTYSESATELNYDTTTSTSDPSYSPTLDQVFLIGDGLTGDGAGATQIFYIPAGATELSFGLADAGGYYGSPGAYGDNIGSYTVNFDEAGGAAPPPTVTPEPSSLLLLGTGLIGWAGTAYRRARSRVIG